MMSAEELRRGDWVEVRGPAEILATLDGDAMLAGLPFMPEMAAYCGRRLAVERRADKLCDTIKYTGSRLLPDSVLLADVRCNGAAHGGCQAECRFYWKNVWLRKIRPDAAPAAPIDPVQLQLLVQFAAARVKRDVEVAERSEERWRCQHTELFRATEPVKTLDPRPYIGQYTNGNVSLGHCVRISARALFLESKSKLGLMPEIFFRGPATQAPPYEPLNLQPGDWVQVRSQEEIVATLSPRGTNRGMWFDREMAAFCGGKHRVRQRIVRFIDDCQDNGRMVELKTDAVTLEGVVCSGELSMHRWFCPRQIYPYWRDCWLRRIEAPAAGQ